MAASVAKAIAEVAPAAATIVGVGLGGSVAVAVTGLLATQWRGLVLVDSLAGLRQLTANTCTPASTANLTKLFSGERSSA